MRLSIYFLYFLFVNNVSAQPKNPEFIQSPNVSSLGIYGSIDISPFNGLPNINIDVFALKGKEITVKANLRYFGGGVQPESHPGWVGQNWTLDIGGVVTRKINGIVDEVAQTNFNDDETFAYWYHFSDLASTNWYSTPFIQNYWPNNTNSSEIKGPRLSPDEFFFTLPSGTSGSFLKNHEGKWIVKSSDEDKLKVSVELNTEPFKLENLINPYQFITIKRLVYKIEIVDKGGIKYTFGEDPNSIEFFRAQRQHSVPNNEDVIASAWHLTKIDGRNGEVIHFIYERRENQYIQSVKYPHTINSSFSNYLMNQKNIGQCSQIHTSSPTYSSKILTPSYLKSITSANFQVMFNITETSELQYDYQYGILENYNYEDLYQDYEKRELLNHNPPQWYKLNSIEVFDNKDNLKNKYIFNYNDNPLKRLFLEKFSKIGKNNNSIDYKFKYNEIELPDYNSLRIDEWGYYNGKTYPSNTAGLSIPQVISYLSPDANLMKAGLLTEIVYPTGGFTKFYYEPNDYSKVLEKNGNSINLINKTGFGGGVRINKIEDYTGSILMQSKEYLYVNSQNSLSSGILSGHKKIYYDFQIGNPSLGNAQLLMNNAVEDLNYTNGRNVVYSEIKEILQDNSYTIYKYSNSDNPDYRDEVPLNIYSDAYIAISGNSNTHPSSNTYPVISHNSRELERGRLLSQQSYNSNGLIVLSIEKEYRNDPGRFEEFVRSYDVNAMMQIECDGVILNERYFQAIKVYTYFPYLKKQTITNYDENGSNALSTVTNFTYDGNRNVKEKSVQSSNTNKTLITAYTYPYEYSSTVPPLGLPTILLAERSMVDKHILSIPSETITYVEIDGLRKVSGAMLNTFQKKSNSDLIVPSASFVLGLTNPIDDFVHGKIVRRSEVVNSVMKFYESWEYDSRYYKNTNYEEFDNVGNVLQFRSQGNELQSYLWDYNRTYPIAQAVNALVNDIAYTSFDADGKGNWIYSGLPFSDPTAFTGSKVYNPSLGQISKSISTSGVYAVSYWSKNGNLNVNNTSATAGLSINGWTHYTHNVHLSVGGTIIISGSATIDELRLHPNTAQMVTYTYDPLIGMASETNINNQTMYYEYDDLGRLDFIKDYEKNILKKFCYNYSGKPEDCEQVNVIPDWQNTATPKRCRFLNNNRTGEQEQEQLDINPFSPTYNQLKWVITGINLTICPVPPLCDYSNCEGEEGKRCIDDICETGVQVFTGSHKEGPYTFCDYHYEWSDGSWSGEYSVEVPPGTICGEIEK